ncbi:MAG: hypothetical protein AB8C02_00465 [Halioglobus sp.]
MNIVIKATVTVAALLMVNAAHATSFIKTERLKTGIHPKGGFYKIYQVQCDTRSTATIASLEGNKRWCIANDSSMTCFRQKQTAANNACSSGGSLAATNELTNGAGYR